MNGDDFLKKDLIDFEKEIKYFNRENNYFEKFLIFFKEYNWIFEIAIFFIGICLFLVNLKAETSFSQDFKNFLYIVLLNLIYILFSYFLVHNSYSKKMVAKFEKTSKTYGYYMSIFNYFEQYLYPEDYKEEFRKYFKKFYEKDKEKFEDWIYHKQITRKKLYAKLLGNKALQKEIFEEILKKNTLKIAKENEVKVISEIKEENKKRKLEIQTNKIKKEMEEYFGQNFGEN